MGDPTANQRDSDTATSGQPALMPVRERLLADQTDDGQSVLRSLGHHRITGPDDHFGRLAFGQDFFQGVRLSLVNGQAVFQPDPQDTVSEPALIQLWQPF